MDTVIPLLEACGAGEFEAVKTIVEELGADVNATGAYSFESAGETVTVVGASPLFVAAGNCNLGISKYLIGKGSNVNSRTTVRMHKYAGMVPLHAAISLRQDKTWFQKKAIVKLLISNGADVSVLTANGSSMWMLCQDGKVERNFLIKFAVSLTRQFPGKNCAALHHFASSSGRAYVNDNTTSIVELLLSKGVDPKALDFCGLTPLNVAAIGYHSNYVMHLGPNEPVLRYFLKREDTSLLEKIDALELAGAITLLIAGVMIPHNGTYGSQALGFWNEAQDLRDNPQGSIPKVPWKVNSTIPWRAVEWSTRDELRELLHRPFAEKRIQALLVGRRILSRVSLKAFVLHLWNESFFMHCHHLLSAKRYTQYLNICWIFLEAARGHDPDDNELGSMIAEVTLFTERALMKLKNEHNPILNLETLKLSLELVFATNNRSPHLSAARSANIRGYVDPIYPICRLVAILSDSPEMMTHEIKRCLHEFVKRDGRKRCNLLLNACNRKPTAGSVAVIALLLEVGADANAVDERGNSALHFVVYWMEEEDNDSPTAALLLKHGAHLDAANKLQQTPLDVWKKKHEKAGRILSPPDWMNVVLPLACLSARSIQRSKIPYKHLSKSVRDFVSIH